MDNTISKSDVINTILLFNNKATYRNISSFLNRNDNVNLYNISIFVLSDLMVDGIVGVNDGFYSVISEREYHN